MREIEGRWYDDLRQPAGLRIAGTEPVEQRVAGLHETGQDDEQIAGRERDDERRLRFGKDVASANGRQRGDESGEHPEAHEQGHAHIRHEVDLQTADLLQVQRSSRVRRNGKQPIGREACHQSRDSRNRVPRDLQDVEKPLLALGARQCEAQQEGEQDYGGHDVVGQGVKRVRRNVQADEIERRPTLHQAGAEERCVLNRRET